VLNTITPETETSCHYFWAFARNYSLHEQRSRLILQGRVLQA
jgi:vanillate O-demethylase monooxygenase subunit